MENHYTARNDRELELYERGREEGASGWLATLVVGWFAGAGTVALFAWLFV